MKIVHTSDLHLGHRLYNYDRADEEERLFEQLGGVVAAERPDALVIAGDIFHTGVPGNDVAKTFTDRLLQVAEASPSMTTVVIAGNHDSYSRLLIDETLWKRLNVHIFGFPAEDAEGRAVFEKNVVEIPGKGFIAAVPFCHPRNFPAVGETASEKRDAAYFAGMSAYLAERNKENLPCTLVAHLAVGSGSSFLGQDRSYVIGGAECVEPEMLGAGYDYIALGHIHCPQWVRGERKLARYCGTPRAIHFDETYPHGVDVVTVERGVEPVVRTENFEALRSLVTIGGEEGVEFEEALKQLVERNDFAGETYIRLNVALATGMSASPEWAERARKAASDKGLRFCTINLIRAKSEETENASAAQKSLAEIKALSRSELIEILAKRKSLGEKQVELLEKVLEEAGV